MKSLFVKIVEILNWSKMNIKLFQSLEDLLTEKNNFKFTISNLISNNLKSFYARTGKFNLQKKVKRPFQIQNLEPFEEEYLLIEKNNKIIAMLIFSLIYQTKNTYWISGVYVLKKYRGQKLCNHMIKHLINFKIGYIFKLAVASYNKPAIKCYEHIGFVIKKHLFLGKSESFLMEYNNTRITRIVSERLMQPEKNEILALYNLLKIPSYRKLLNDLVKNLNLTQSMEIIILNLNSPPLVNGIMKKIKFLTGISESHYFIEETEKILLNETINDYKLFYGSISNISFEKETFDVSLIYLTLQYCKNYTEIMTDLIRVSKNKIYIIEPQWTKINLENLDNKNIELINDKIKKEIINYNIIELIKKFLDIKKIRFKTKEFFIEWDNFKDFEKLLMFNLGKIFNDPSVNKFTGRLPIILFKIVK